MCSPPKYSKRTLSSSGNVLGLSLPGALAQTRHRSLLQELRQQELIETKLWSVTLLDSQSGILSLGSTITSEVEEAKVRTQVELHNIANPGADAKFIDDEVQSRLRKSKPKDWRGMFRWSEAQGAKGWWTALMQGVWINKVKILRNQPVLFDIQVPFILAPPLSARRFYESIGGAKRLNPPFDMFFAFPCLNQPEIAFEFNAWIFTTMTGESGIDGGFGGPAGGKMSLGKEKEGSGYCIGMLVESRGAFRAENEKNGSDGHRRHGRVGNGLKNMWIVGDPFFRGLGLVFDIEEKQIGFRSY